MSIFDSVNHGLLPWRLVVFRQEMLALDTMIHWRLNRLIIVFMFIGGINFTLIWFLLAKEIMERCLMKNSKPISYTYLLLYFL
ncbi:MAG: hypothetical protein CM15mP8_4720 [Methanobacteriota archaeon]|nr:MAG: hypothetical protein CM15mP8_4720 [Euryarchaeota archaeon]